MLHRTANGRFKKKHGIAKHPLYQIWKNIHQRCYNPEHRSYKWYGAKGIMMCDLWKNDCKSFYKWAINNNWEKGLEVDRIDPNAGYSPENCRLVCHAENMRASSQSKLSWADIIDIRNAKLLLSSSITNTEIAEAYGVSATLISNILKNKTWAEPWWEGVYS